MFSVAVDNCPKVLVKWFTNETTDVSGPFIYANLSLTVAEVILSEFSQEFEVQ